MSFPVITKIEWLGLPEDGEAEVTIRGESGLKVKAFCHPCHFAVDDLLKEPMLAFDSRNIEVLLGPPIPRFEPADSRGGACFSVGIVEEASRNLVLVGNFQVELDVPLPGDVDNGDWIAFECERFDLC